MGHHLVTECLNEPASLSFWWETLSIFLGDIAATVFLASLAYVLFYLLKYPGFRVEANWSSSGGDLRETGRPPGNSDNAPMEVWPNVSVVSRDTDVKKVIVAISVRERADETNPDEVHGVHRLQEDTPIEHRTTGADPLKLIGPRISCNASNYQRFSNMPIFIETSDGRLHRAQSPGNPIKGIAKLRYRIQDFSDAAMQSILSKLG
jgi:hypothetical protein